MQFFSHPSYLHSSADWTKWRIVFNGGEPFLDEYLRKFSTRETTEDFLSRKAVTPIPAFAKAAINDIKASLFQRMVDITRTGGSITYQKAVKGEMLGVDNRGRSMTAFIGQELLEDLLVIGKVGVWVDAPANVIPTLASETTFKPYLYAYSPEDIINWKAGQPEDPGSFESVVLRETIPSFDDRYYLPNGVTNRYRHAWISPETGRVMVQLYDADYKPIDLPIELSLTRIPFVLLDIKHSLMEDIANHQIALLNLWSSTVSNGIQNSFSIYTEQRDSRDVGGHLKQSANADGTASIGGQGGSEENIKVGSMKGRFYDMNAERPGFIHASEKPLLANLQLAEKLEQDTRALVNLAVSNLGSQVSAESRSMENQGLESGLSFIGLVLENAERDIARHWAAYESVIESKRQVAFVKYPDRWNLKTREQRLEEADQLIEVSKRVPGQQIKKEANKFLIRSLLGDRLPEDTIQKIFSEIESAPFTTSDPKIIQMAKEQGLVGDETGSLALGFDPGEHLKAQADHVRRLKEIQIAQTPPEGQPTNGVNGIKETQADPDADKKAKEPQKDNTDKPELKPATRGEGKAV